MSVHEIAGKKARALTMRTCWLLFIIMALFSYRLFGEENKARDPFQTNISQPPVNARPQINEVGEIIAKLEGISIGSNGSFAVINGQVYREGESKNGIKIAKIRKKEVDILINGISETLQMVPMKKSSAEAREDVK